MLTPSLLPQTAFARTPFGPIVSNLLGLADDANLLGRLDAVAAVDAYRRGDNLVVHADLPGVDPEQIQITVDAGWLTIEAERGYTPDPDDRVVISERAFGRLRRRIHIGDQFNSEGASASYDRGVLVVTVPVRANSERRSIPVVQRDVGAQAALQQNN